MALNATHNTKIVISAEDKTKGAFASAQQGVEGLLGSFAKFGTVGVVGVLGVVATAINKIARETAQAQAEQAQLAAVLRSTGEAAGWSREQLNKMADDLSKKSVFAAGDITNAQTRLLSYTGIVGQQFPRAMQATIDMAQRMGMTVEQSAETIGRALDIPSQGLTALTRQGFRFTEAQKELVKELEATGRTAEAQNIILKALEGSYGGAAEAARNTMGGAMQALRNSMDDLFEASDTGGSIFVRIINDMALAVDGLSAAMRGVPFDFMDKLLPNYEKYRQAMDKEFGPPPGTWQPAPDNNMLPRGATIGGGLSLTEQIQQRAAAFTENNKLTDAVAKQAEYAAKLAEINTLEREGGLTAELAARYRAQLHAQTFKVKDATEKWTEAEEHHRNRIQVWIKQHEELYKARVATAEAMQAQIAQMDDAVRSTSEETEAVRQQIAVMQYGENAVIRMEAARLMEAAAAAEQGLEYAKLNGLTTDQISFMEAAIQKTRELADARLQLATSRESKAAFELEQKRVEDLQKKQEEAVKEAENEVRRAAESMNQSITDALLRGFEDGLGFAENFRQTLMNMFKTLILRPAINFLVSPLTSALAAGGLGAGGSGAAFAGGLFPGGGGSGGLGLLSQGKNLLNVIQNGFSGLNNSLTSAIGDLGTFLSTGNGGLGDVLGGFIGQYSSQIANVLPFAGAAFSLLTGDVKGAVSQGIGAALGTAVGGPVGGIIGSALGSFVGGLFGNSGERFKQAGDARVSVYKNGKISNRNYAVFGDRMNATNDYLDSLNQQFLGNINALTDAFDVTGIRRVVSGFRMRRTSGRLATDFRFGGSGVSSGRLSDEFGGDGEMKKALKMYSEKVMGEYMVLAIQKSKLPRAIKDLFDGFAKSKQVTNLINATINLSRAQDGLADRFGLTVVQAAQVSKEIGGTGNALVKFINTFAATANSFVSIGDQLISFRTDLEGVYGGELPENLKAFDAALKGINTKTRAGISAFAELYLIRDDFEKYRAAIDGLKGNVRGAIFSMVSDQEKLEMQREDMAKIFTELGYAIPGSIQELVALGKSIDFTTAEGLNLASVFPTLVQAFNAVGDAATELQDALNPNNFSTLTDFIRANAYRNNGIPMSMLPSYDVGTSYVPRTGPAIIHAGERILTASENRSFTQSSADLVAEVRALGAKVAELLRSSDDTAKNTRKTSDLLTRVTEDGRVMLTEAMA